MLAWTIYLSFIGAAAVTLAPAAVARFLALLTTLAGLALAIVAVAQDRSGQLITIVRTQWIPSLGIEYHLAADGIRDRKSVV